MPATTYIYIPLQPLMTRKTTPPLLLGMLIAALLMFSVGAMAQPKTRGIASYYHDSLHGRLMANGKPYNRDSISCAHLKFPLGTRLLVTNTRNGRSRVIPVTDRGPYSRKFVIDLSRRAARELGIIGAPFTVVEMVPIGSNHVVPLRMLDLDSLFVPQLELDMAPFGDAPVWLADSAFHRKMAKTHVIHKNIILGTDTNHKKVATQKDSIRKQAATKNDTIRKHITTKKDTIRHDTTTTQHRDTVRASGL